jgi:putative phage-type endonuclease
MSAALQQGTAEWLQLRRSCVGASDAPVIMGVSPWKTAYQLWEEKLGLREPQMESGAMRRGLDMEESARKAFERETGIIVFPAVLFHREHEWMMASLDGIDIEHRNIVEIKCPGRQDHESAMDGVIPEKYWPQLQHQMEVCHLDEAFYFSYREDSCKILKAERDSGYIQELISKEKDFYKCLQDFEAPHLSDGDYVVRNDDIWRQAARKWAEVNILLEGLKDEEDKLRKELIRMAGKSHVRGAGIKVSRHIRIGAVNYGSIPELQGIDLERYRKQSSEIYRISHA